MNVAVVLMTSVLMPGADPMPAAQSAPVVVSGQGGCSNCGSGPISYSSNCKNGLLEKIKAKFARSSCECECAKPQPAPRPNLLDHLKAKYGKKPGPSTCGCCGTVAAPAAPSTAPMDMPKTDPKPADPKAKPKVSNESDAIQIPQAPPIAPVGTTPGAVIVPAQPITPVSGPKLNSTDSPY